MDFHRWSSLFRSYDVTLRHNQLLLGLALTGMIAGLVMGEGDWQAIFLNGAVVGLVVFIAGALAKELDPDHSLAALLSAAAALFLSVLIPSPLPVALFWLLGCSRFLNRTTGLKPKLTDLLALLAVTAWLCWQETPLFGILMGILLIMDSSLPDGQGVYRVLGVMGLLASGIWLVVSEWSAVEPAPVYILALLAIAVGFIPVILGSYQVEAIGDATGDRLSSSRIQAGQVFALSAGLLSASLIGEWGITLLTGLWAALLGCSTAHILLARSRRSVSSL